MPDGAKRRSVTQCNICEVRIMRFWFSHRAMLVRDDGAGEHLLPSCRTEQSGDPVSSGEVLVCGSGSRITLRLCGMTVWASTSCRHAGRSDVEIPYPVQHLQRLVDEIPVPTFQQYALAALLPCGHDQRHELCELTPRGETVLNAIFSFTGSTFKT